MFALLFATRIAAAVEFPAPPATGSREDDEKILWLVSGTNGIFRIISAGPEAIWLGLYGNDHKMVGMLTLLRLPADPDIRFRSRSFAIQIGNMSPDPQVVETLVRAARMVALHDDGSWARSDIAEAVTQLEPPPHLRLVALLSLVPALVLAAYRRRVKLELRLPHIIPAIIQTLLFSYWALYWPGVRHHAPTIALQLVIAFALDATFSFARFGSWRIGLSPLPIVFSTNLFSWFNTPGIVISLVTAFATKTFLHRAGRHLLNPSAIGLTVAGLCFFFIPDVRDGGNVFHAMNLAPNMAELVILLALLPQLRFRIVPVSICALLTLWALHIPAVLRPALLLSITLLATDPATIPKTSVGQVLFGVFLGAGIPLTSQILRHFMLPDGVAKVLPIPVANLLVPLFDFLGTRAASLGARAWAALRRRPKSEPLTALRPVPNLALVAVWLLMVIPRIGLEKPDDFEPALHWTWGTPLVQPGPNDVPTCEDNAIFCKPFTFAQEWRFWRKGVADMDRHWERYLSKHESRSRRTGFQSDAQGETRTRMPRGATPSR